MNWLAFRAAFGRMLLWTLGLLLLVHLITWISPQQDGYPTLPGWAEGVVWALFVVPVFPAMLAGAARLRGHRKLQPILLGLIFGLLTPLLGMASLLATFLLIGGNIDLGPHDERISERVIVMTLFSSVVVLGVVTALIRSKESPES